MSVVVVDIGIGNTHSVVRALVHVGAQPVLTADPDAVRTASHVVFPGVGAFGDCAAAARQLGMTDAITDYAKSGRPLIGLCVGMQLLFQSSTEFGHHEGMGLMAGSLDKIPTQNSDGTLLRVPHVGWSTVTPTSRSPLFSELPDAFSAYFVHSYAVLEKDAPDCCAVTRYGDNAIVAAAQKDMLFGVQFHPEKSGPAGLKILENFIRL